MNTNITQEELSKRHSDLESGRLREVTGTNVVDEIHISRYRFAMQFTNGKTLLDIASGIGYGSFMLADTGKAKSVTGVDISQAPIMEAKTKYKRDNLRFEVISPDKLPFDDASFDVITSYETVEHTYDRTVFLKELRRVLKSGGMLIISTPNKRYHSIGKKVPWNPNHTVEYYPVEFKKVLSGVFPQIEFWGGQEFLPINLSPVLKYNWIEFKYYNINNSKMFMSVLGPIRSIRNNKSAPNIAQQSDPATQQQNTEIFRKRADIVPWVDNCEPYTMVAVCKK
ncbi:MAG: class I SAM-dependent methyltransferase [Bacteroidota bacterium]